MKRLFLTALVIVCFLEVGMVGRARNNSWADSVQDQIVGGWTEEEEEATWTYSSANDGVNTFTVYRSGDATGFLFVPMRIRCKQAGGYLYFITTSVGTYDEENNRTEVKLFGGTDFNLTDATITDVAFSNFRFPTGFSPDPADWTIEVTGGDPFVQNSPTQNDWYTTGITIDVPVGTWRLLYVTHVGIVTTGVVGTIQSTLSTTNNSSTNLAYLRQLSVTTAGDDVGFSQAAGGEDVIFLDTETTYYVNIRTTTASNVTDISSGYYLVRAVCAYL